MPRSTSSCTTRRSGYSCTPSIHCGACRRTSRGVPTPPPSRRRTTTGTARAARPPRVPPCPPFPSSAVAAGLIARRLLQAAAALLVVLLVVFACLLTTGDPVEMLAPPEASERDKASIRQAYGLDRPLVYQFGAFVWRAARGDFGRSL